MKKKLQLLYVYDESFIFNHLNQNLPAMAAIQAKARWAKPKALAAFHLLCFNTRSMR
ncbi:hypothetical protein [Acinetobacter sp. WCHAc010034]|uniref:hypothetical protein n=1 Tax=Acinetobacter sp. WCHAc010034 TaxID=1879049 RepID=UPI0013C3451B|nr:hypothetical protein [Acinetobacter sp. WCHAc010034]